MSSIAFDFETLKKNSHSLFTAMVKWITIRSNKRGIQNGAGLHTQERI